MDSDHFSGRRSFLLGIGAAAAAVRGRGATTTPELPDPLRPPGRVMAFAEGDAHGVSMTRTGNRWQANGVEIAVERGVITVSAPTTRLMRVRFRWDGSFPDGCRFLGDHWERSYGDLEWRGLAGERLMPWYVLAWHANATHGYGVMTGAAAICAWQTDAGGLTLWLDVSNGGSGVELGERPLEAATIVVRKGHTGES
ncbi:MAG TPA: hypothetical protein VMU80_01195, partial [Bryobacteraceae bacterium]|nr:hypothetical protein [Bryobacteraceae bacterium]